MELLGLLLLVGFAVGLCVALVRLGEAMQRRGGQLVKRGVKGPGLLFVLVIVGAILVVCGFAIEHAAPDMIRNSVPKPEAPYRQYQPVPNNRLP